MKTGIKRASTFWHRFVTILKNKTVIPEPEVLEIEREMKLQSWTKLLRHFTKFPLIQGTITNVFNPPPPFQCCQCCYVVKTKSGEFANPRKQHWAGGAGVNIIYPLVSQDIREKCMIFVCFNYFCPWLLIHLRKTFGYRWENDKFGMFLEL